MLFSIYPKDLASLLEKKPGYIPRRIHYKESLKLYRKYWNAEIPKYIYKVESIFDSQDDEYYQLRAVDNIYQVILSYPVFNEICFEMMQDRNDIKNLSNIINTSTPYFGSEIRYWFFENKIRIDDEKYIGFRPYIEYIGKSSLSDNKIYFLKAELINNIYYNCHAITYK